MFNFRLCYLFPLAAMLCLAQSKSDPVDKFRQLEEILPTANAYRTASGAPGHAYWQQQVDYVMDLELDDQKQRLSGKETITYHNNSPDRLSYLWLQLDQNRFAKNSIGNLSSPAMDMEKVGYGAIRRSLTQQKFEGGYKISNLVDASGKKLAYTIVDTMMRIDLPLPLASGETTVFSLDWSFNIVEQKVLGGRGGYEHFPEEDNYLYEIAQFFPRLATYTDATGWQHKQFMGRGEFTVEFGNYRVSIKTPADHVVAATGVLQNPAKVLEPKWRKRLEKAATASKPVLIITPEEAKANESSRSDTFKTWVFAAENVRDFAFASSRKFIWDAQGYNNGDDVVLAMSYYPNEGNPLWEKYSTEAIIQTLEVYGRYTFVYPYPVAISVNGPVGGMEYPMICFNGPRPEKDGTYTAGTKYGLISVVIHEVGHNFFPMIVNSDERQWTWMDEGINSFLQHQAEDEWEADYPSRRGRPRGIGAFMVSENQVPIMTNSESLLQFGNNAYAKPAAALHVLRDTILGRELFDFAFREYSRRWAFRRPNPADFFRSMEDASGVDLDWFWRGWFYSTDHVDIAITGISRHNVDTLDPDKEQPIEREEQAVARQDMSRKLDKNLARRIVRKPELNDFYNKYDKFTVTDVDRDEYLEDLEDLKPEEKAMLEVTENFYVLDFENLGGLVSPIILALTYDDGSSEELRIPAEIWRFNHKKVSKTVITNKILVSVAVDPYFETGDADLENNHYPKKEVISRFQMFKREKKKNTMQKMRLKEEPNADASSSAKTESSGGQH